MNVKILMMLCGLIGCSTVAYAEFRQDFTQLREDLKKTEFQGVGSSEFSRLKGYFLGLAPRLEQITAVQKQVLSKKTKKTDAQLHWSAEQLLGAIVFADQSAELKKHPKYTEIRQRLDSAEKAQKQALLSFAKQSQEGGFSKAQTQAYEEAMAALTLLKQGKSKDQSKQKKSQQSDPKSPGEQSTEKRQKQDQEKPKPSKAKPDSKQGEQKKDSAAEQQEGNAQLHQSDSKESLQAREALKKLLKLQQKAADEKDFRKKRLGVHQRGTESVEKDW